MDWVVVLSWTLNSLLLLNIVLALVIIFNERRDAGTTWAWLLILFFLPILGFIVYLFFGRHLTNNNFYNLSEDEQSYYTRQVDAQVQRIQAGETEYDEELLNKYEQLLIMNLRSSKSLVSFYNETRIFSEGNEKFDTMIQDISNAQEEVNVQYYIIKRDALGQRLFDALLERAKAGVKVRLLYDAVGSKSLKQSDFKELIEHGGEVEIFFPSKWGINFRLNNRNHRKVCIIDGKIGYIGGFNVGTEYLGEVEKFGYWRDVHLRIEGDVVHHIQDRFVLDWNYANQYKNRDDIFCFPPHQIRHFSPMQIVTSGPNSHTEHLKNMKIKMISSAKREIYIQTPYFIPDKSFMDACKMALLSGVKMHIMIPGKPDHPFVMWGSWSFLGELLDYGADVYLYDRGFLHSKTLTVDGEISTVGTTNLDARSFRLNFEINTLVFNRRIALELESLFESDMADCRKLTKELYAQRDWTIKLREGFARLLSPIL
ncbi:cardiolipin synthase [Planococcus citreus]|uniref:Cardiolipin synthase n=1 Tax=Planococcus citreus TaxID=1373 RepID=A0A497YF97_9BACL|nr:cardiolipin synthase [Planococcus citreus]RLJ86984.1 cardiolipin synthase [Planococcus citreus]